jgi:hypothetical protein
MSLPPAASSDPVSLRRIRADAVRRDAMVLDDALADALDLLPRAKPAISAHLPRDSRGRTLAKSRSPAARPGADPRHPGPPRSW